MITVSIRSSYNVLSMAITHDECFESSSLTDILDKIEEVYDYIFVRKDNEIRFTIDNHWIETRANGHSVFVYYHNLDEFFERICSRYEIKFLDDDTIHLHCYYGDRLVSSTKII